MVQIRQEELRQDIGVPQATYWAKLSPEWVWETQKPVFKVQFSQIIVLVYLVCWGCVPVPLDGELHLIEAPLSTRRTSPFWAITASPGLAVSSNCNSPVRCHGIYHYQFERSKMCVPSRTMVYSAQGYLNGVDSPFVTVKWPHVIGISPSLLPNISVYCNPFARETGEAAAALELLCTCGSWSRTLMRSLFLERLTAMDIFFKVGMKDSELATDGDLEKLGHAFYKPVNSPTHDHIVRFPYRAVWRYRGNWATSFLTSFDIGNAKSLLGWEHLTLQERKSGTNNPPKQEKHDHVVSFYFKLNMNPWVVDTRRSSLIVTCFVELCSTSAGKSHRAMTWPLGSVEIRLNKLYSRPYSETPVTWIITSQLSTCVSRYIAIGLRHSPFSTLIIYTADFQNDYQPRLEITSPPSLHILLSFSQRCSVTIRLKRAMSKRGNLRKSIQMKSSWYCDSFFFFCCARSCLCAFVLTTFICLGIWTWRERCFAP